MRNNEVYAIFERDPSEQILPVIENQQIVGLINRERFMGTMAGRFHWEVYSKKRCKKTDGARPRGDRRTMFHR